MADYKQKFADATCAFANKAPTMEPAFAWHEKSALRLYDQIIPKLQENSYATGLKCVKCKEKREENGVKDLPMTMAEMKI